MRQVETVGDKYMLASGLPERSTVHAKNIALVALDMMDIAREIVVDGQGVKVGRYLALHFSTSSKMAL